MRHWRRLTFKPDIPVLQEDNVRAKSFDQEQFEAVPDRGASRVKASDWAAV